MQRGRVLRQEVSNSRLLAIITAVLIAILAVPVIIPHITHTDMIYHILVHITSVIIAVFLTVISIMAYRRNGGARTPIQANLKDLVSQKIDHVFRNLCSVFR